MEIELQFRRVQDKLLELVKTSQLLRKENIRLVSELGLLREKETGWTGELEKMRQTIQVLRAASSRMDEADKKEFEKTINHYIKDIDHCIGMLSD